MKEEAQGFPTAWGSMGFPLRPKARGVSEKAGQLGKSKFTIYNGHPHCRALQACYNILL